MHNGLARLTEPMVRENDVLRLATWDEALDRAAKGLKAATDLKGGAGVGIFSCSKATNEMNFIAQKSHAELSRLERERQANASAASLLAKTDLRNVSWHLRPRLSLQEVADQGSPPGARDSKRERRRESVPARATLNAAQVIG